jgi:hypothetical protein
MEEALLHFSSPLWLPPRLGRGTATPWRRGGGGSYVRTRYLFRRNGGVDRIEPAETVFGRFPRFGPVVLLEVPGKGRFVTSLREHADAVAALVAR